MKIVTTLSLLFFSLTATAASETVLKIQRVNYKSEKRLHYDVVFDPSQCEINTTKPFDVYYVDNQTGQRLTEFSSDSQKYFGPRLDPAKITANHVALEFKALDEIQTELKTPATILVTVNRDGGACKAVSLISYRNKSFVLERIDLKVKKALGFPAGIHWVLLSGYSNEGVIKDCVIGDCQ